MDHDRQENEQLPGSGMAQMNGREKGSNPFNYNDFTTREACRQCWKIRANLYSRYDRKRQAGSEHPACVDWAEWQQKLANQVNKLCLI